MVKFNRVQTEKFSFFNDRGKVANPSDVARLDELVAIYGRNLSELTKSGVENTDKFTKIDKVPDEKKENFTTIHKGWLKFGTGLTDARAQRNAFGAEKAVEEQEQKAAPAA